MDIFKKLSEFEKLLGIKKAQSAGEPRDVGAPSAGLSNTPDYPNLNKPDAPAAGTGRAPAPAISPASAPKPAGFDQGVAATQRKLNEAGFISAKGPLVVDGKLGPDTRAALNWYKTYKLKSPIMSEKDVMSAFQYPGPNQTA